MLNVISLDEAKLLLKQTILNEGIKYSVQQDTELLPLSEAVGRILAETVYAADDIPAFNRSTVDGYAVRAADTFGASQSMPAVLVFDGEIEMGQVAAMSVIPGHCQGIPTGGALPDGADSVIMLEDVENEDDGFRYMLKSVSPGNNLIFRGDDVVQNSELLTAGTRLLPHHIGALAAAGLDKVSVARRIKAGIISTGNELVPAGGKLLPGQVYDANAPMIEAMLKFAGVQIFNYGIVKDELDQLLSAVKCAWKECDLVIISGGSSAGERDHVCSVISMLGQPGLLQHGLAVKPGKPTLIGFAEHVPVIGLPGHPVAACFMAEQIILPLLDWMSDLNERSHITKSGKLLSRIPANHGRQAFIPVRFFDGNVEPLAVKSGLITTLRGSDGYIVVSRDCEGLNAGAEVKVNTWEDR